MTIAGWLAALVAPFVFWRLIGGGSRSATADRRWRVLELALLAVLALGYVGLMARNVRNPGPWDFPAFYTVAAAAADGPSFYDTADLATRFSELQAESEVPPDWEDQIGYWYAPPSVLAIVPYGVLPYRWALVLHYLLHSGLLVLSVSVLHRRFPFGGRVGLVRIGLLCLAFRPLASAFSLAQIVPGALLAASVAMVTIDRPRSNTAGIALGVGALFKHLLIIPAGLLVLVGRVRPFLSALATLVVASLVTLLFWGSEPFTAFALGGPSDRKPELALYGVIQSLNSTLRRGLDDVPSAAGIGPVILYLPFLAISAVLTLVTVTAMRRQSTRGGLVLGFACALLLALIVYPNTLYNTIALALPSMIVVVARSVERFHQGDRSRSMANLVALCAVYLISAAWPLHAFWGLAIVWLLTVIELFAASSDELVVRWQNFPSASDRPSASLSMGRVRGLRSDAR